MKYFVLDWRNKPPYCQDSVGTHEWPGVHTEYDMLDALASQCKVSSLHYVLGTVILPKDAALRSPDGEWWSNQMMIAGLHTTTTKWFGPLIHPQVFRDEGICADRTLRGRSQSVVGSASPGVARTLECCTEYGVLADKWSIILCTLYTVLRTRTINQIGSFPRPDLVRWYVSRGTKYQTVICISTCACQQPSKSAVRVVNNNIIIK